MVDVVSEDQAIAALALYGAQASTMDQLRERENIFANPGPGDAAAIAARGLDETQQALDEARDIPGADRLAAAYWNDGAHVVALGDLSTVTRDARLIALLTATHDTIYSGSGSIPLDEAYRTLTGTFTSRQEPPPLRRWARALINQLEERDSAIEAAAAREETGQLWATRVRQLEPAAVEQLQDYIAGLPARTVEGLRGHPVAGPALQRLEQEQRMVSSA